MKTLLLVTLSLLFSAQAFSCQCIEGFASRFHSEKKEIAARYLKVANSDIHSIEILKSKTRDRRVDTVAKILLFPFFLTAGECERGCAGVELAGKFRMLVDYQKEANLRCKKIIQIKGRLNFVDELILRKKFKSFGETCKEGR